MRSLPCLRLLDGAALRVGGRERVLGEELLEELLAVGPNPGALQARGWRAALLLLCLGKHRDGGRRGVLAGEHKGRLAAPVGSEDVGARSQQLPHHLPMRGAPAKRRVVQRGPLVPVSPPRQRRRCATRATKER